MLFHFMLLVIQNVTLKRGMRDLMHKASVGVWCCISHEVTVRFFTKGRPISFLKNILRVIRAISLKVDARLLTFVCIVNLSLKQIILKNKAAMHNTSSCG